MRSEGTRLARHMCNFWWHRKGNFATLTALTAPAALALAAIAIDQASLYLERRTLQSVADIAAITAASDLGRAGELATAVFADNGYENVRVMTKVDEAPSHAADGLHIWIERGRYVGDPGRSVNRRFEANHAQPNALRITARKQGQLYFAAGWRPSPIIGVSSLAGSSEQAAFSIGSRLARLEGGVLNRLLGALTGSSISLSAMDYDALLDADIDLFQALDVLDTRLDLKAATYQDVLASDLKLGRLFGELAHIEGLDAGAVASLRRLSQQAGADTAGFRLSGLLDLGTAGRLPVGSRPRNAPALSGAELVTAAAFAAIGRGKNQVEVDLTAVVPGLAETTLHLAVGEPPQGSGWLRIGSNGDIVRTAQTRLLLVTAVSGPGGILGNIVRLPFYLEIASAEARLAAITCSPGNPQSARVSVAARPAVAELRISDVDLKRLNDFSRPVPIQPARLISIPAVRVTAGAHVSVSNMNATTLIFNARDIRDGAVQRVGTRDFTQSLLASLNETLSLNVVLAGIDLGLGQILSGTLRTTLRGVAPILDPTLGRVLSTLGISLGEADIRVHGAECGQAVLVQ